MSLRAGWNLREWKRRCKELRDVLTNSPEICTPQEIEDYWPGGTENRAEGLVAWYYCWQQYGALLRRLEQLDTPSEAKTQLAREAAQDALRGAPVYVTLEARDADGLEIAKGVFPKSFHALAHCSQRDLLLAHLSDQIVKCQAINSPRSAVAIGGALVEVAYQSRVLCWIVCHPEPGLPFGDAEFRPDVDTLAPWTKDLSPTDLIKILQAHRTVNGARLQLVSFLLSPPDANGRRPGSWETLIATAGKTLGRDARALARDTTLESLVAQVALSHEAERPPPGKAA